jgi:hypothetical protein
LSTAVSPTARAKSRDESAYLSPAPANTIRHHWGFLAVPTYQIRVISAFITDARPSLSLQNSAASLPPLNSRRSPIASPGDIVLWGKFRQTLGFLVSDFCKLNFDFCSEIRFIGFYF